MHATAGGSSDSDFFTTASLQRSALDGTLSLPGAVCTGIMSSSDVPVLFIGQKNYSSWSMRPWLLLKEVGFHFVESSVELEGRGSL